MATGSLLHTFNNPNAGTGRSNDRFGGSISMNDTYVGIGSAGYEQLYGRVYVYRLSTQNLTYTMENPNPYALPDSDYFGISVGVGPSFLVAGAYREDDVGAGDTGKAYIFAL